MSAAVALPLMVGAGTISAIEQRKAGYQQASVFDSEAAESKREAMLTEVAGTEAIRQGKRQAAFLRGSQEEAAAGGGVASNTGSPLEIAQEDARENRYNMLKTKFAYDSKAFSLERQAQLQSWEAGKTRQAANMQLVTGLLTTGASAFYYGKGSGMSIPSSLMGGGFGTANEEQDRLNQEAAMAESKKG